MKKLLLLILTLQNITTRYSKVAPGSPQKKKYNKSFSVNKEEKTKEREVEKLEVMKKVVDKMNRSEILDGEKKSNSQLRNLVQRWNLDIKSKMKKNTPFIDQKKKFTRIQHDFKKFIRCDSEAHLKTSFNIDFIKSFELEALKKNNFKEFFNFKNYVDFMKFPNYDDHQRKILLQYYLVHVDKNMCKSDYEIFKTITNVPECSYEKKNEKIYKKYPLPNLTYYEILEVHKLIKEFYSIINLFFTYIPVNFSRAQIYEENPDHVKLIKMALEKIYYNPQFDILIDKIIKKANFLDDIINSIDCGVKTYTNFYSLMMRFYKIYISTLPSITKDIFYKKLLDLKNVWISEIVSNFLESFYFVNFIAVFIREMAYQSKNNIVDDEEILRFAVIIKDFHEVIMSVISRMGEFDEYIEQNYNYLTEIMEDIERILEIGITETKDIHYVLKSQEFNYSDKQSSFFLIKEIMIFFIFFFIV